MPHLHTRHHLLFLTHRQVQQSGVLLTAAHDVALTDFVQHVSAQGFDLKTAASSCIICLNILITIQTQCPHIQLLISKQLLSKE